VRLALLLTTFKLDHWLTFGFAGIFNDKLVLESLHSYQFPSPFKGILESIGFSLIGYFSVCDLYAVVVFVICMRWQHSDSSIALGKSESPQVHRK
jgi:hypothetical protein